ncbi:UvrD-helicase domain-containing protein, partial [Candidatus Collinsella stercoripullorum]
MDLTALMPQQREIVTTLDRPLFVSAGAGSGKTFTLTRRILWALSPESGPFIDHLDQVLAITFTKDAAAEIRERVRAALIGAGMAEEALTVDDAWISTIHGMCSRILRAHALELGIDPEFTVVEDADELVARAVDRAVARAEAGGA